MYLRPALLGFCLLAVSIDAAIADPFLLVTGRRDCGREDSYRYVWLAGRCCQQRGIR